MKLISRLFVFGVVHCSWSEYKNASPYEQLVLHYVSEEKMKHDIKLAGGKIGNKLGLT